MRTIYHLLVLFVLMQSFYAGHACPILDQLKTIEDPIRHNIELLLGVRSGEPKSRAREINDYPDLDARKEFMIPELNAALQSLSPTKDLNGYSEWIVWTHPRAEFIDRTVHFIQHHPKLRHLPILLLVNYDYPLTSLQSLSDRTLIQFSISGEIHSYPVAGHSFHMMGETLNGCLMTTANALIRPLDGKLTEAINLTIYTHYTLADYSAGFEPVTVDSLLARNDISRIARYLLTELYGSWTAVNYKGGQEIISYRQEYTERILNIRFVRDAVIENKPKTFESLFKRFLKRKKHSM